MQRRLFLGSLRCQQDWTPTRSCYSPLDRKLTQPKKARRGNDSSEIFHQQISHPKCMKLAKFICWEGNPERSRTFFGKITGKIFQANPVPKNPEFRDFAKSRPGNPGIENSWSRLGLVVRSQESLPLPSDARVVTGSPQACQLSSCQRPHVSGIPGCWARQPFAGTFGQLVNIGCVWHSERN